MSEADKSKERPILTRASTGIDSYRYRNRYYLELYYIDCPIASETNEHTTRPTVVSLFDRATFRLGCVVRT